MVSVGILLRCFSNHGEFGFVCFFLLFLFVINPQTVLAQEGRSGLFLLPRETIALDANPHSISVDEALNKVYVGLKGKILVIDGEKDKVVHEIVLGFDVEVLEFNSRTGQLIADGEDLATYNYITCVINSENEEIVGYLEKHIVFSYRIAVNPDTNRIYIANPTSTIGRYDRVHVYDGDTLTEIATIDIPGSDEPIYVQDLGVAVDPSNNRVYVAWSYRKTLLVYNGTDHTLIMKKENLTSFSEHLFANPSTNRIYIGGLTLNENLNPVEGINLISSRRIKAYIPDLDLLVYSMGYESLGLLSGQDNEEVLSLDLDHDVHYAAVNCLTNKIYLIDIYNPAVSVFSFSFDNEAPSLTVTSPSAGSLLTVQTLRVEWEGFDETSGIEHYEVRLDGREWVNVGLETSHNFTYVYDGNRSVSVKAFDYAGNWDEATVNFYVDTTPPSIYFTTPTDEETVKMADVTIRWSGYDSYGVERFKIKIDGGTWIEKGTSEQHTFTNLEEGTHTLTVRAYDIAGHVTEASITFTVNLSLIGGPGWIDDIIIFSAAAIIVVVALFVLRRRKKTTVHYEKPAPPPLEKPATPRPDEKKAEASRLLTEVRNHVALFIEDKSQQERIDRLVSLGSDVIPQIESTIWNIIRYGDTIAQFENASLLCEAIGKIGGDNAFNVLSRFATQDSNIAEYSYVRAGAARGLAYLYPTIPQALEVLKRVGDRYGLGETVNKVLEQVGGKPIETWDKIAKDFILSEVDKEKPDFKAFSKRLKPFSADERHGAWIHVAQALRDKGRKEEAAMCYLEALHNQPVSSSIAWGWLTGEYDQDMKLLPPDVPRTRETIEKLRREHGITTEISEQEE